MTCWAELYFSKTAGCAARRYRQGEDIRDLSTLDATLVLDAHAEVGEGPVWDSARARLLWVDIPAGVIHVFDPATGVDHAQSVGQPVGAVAIRSRGGLVAAVRDGFGVFDAGTLRIVAPVEADRIENQMNDGKVDPQGRFWAGTMARDMSADVAALYRLDPDFRVHQVLAPLSVPNGLDWSADGRCMYFIDSLTAGVDVFDFEPDAGTISGRRRLCEIPAGEGMADGMTVDAEGHLWVAIWGAGEVRRFAADGRHIGSIRLPVTQVTSCAFGGPHLDTLFITTAAEDVADREPHAGGLFACKPGSIGRACHTFVG